MPRSMAQAAPHTIGLNDLSRAADSLRDETVLALTRVAHSGRYLNGPESDAFEEDFAAYVGVGYCVGVANGTDALELALLGVGCLPGSEVVTAANAGLRAQRARQECAAR